MDCKGSLQYIRGMKNIKGHHCKKCGEANPVNFYAGRTRECKSCKKKYTANRYNNDVMPLEYHLYHASKQRAKRNGLPFNLELSDITIPSVCPILGIELVKGNGGVHNASPTLDKVVPELGYVKGNVQVVSHLANTMKSNASAEHLQAFVDNIMDYMELNSPLTKKIEKS